jgi:hypothetical protein
MASPYAVRWGRPRRRRLLLVRVAPDGELCGCGCGCGDLAEIDLRSPGQSVSDLLCFDCLATALESWVGFHDTLGGLTA